MSTDKKNKWLQWIQTVTIVLSFLILVFAGYKGAIAWGEYTANQKAIQDARMFKSAEQRIKTKNHVNSPWTEYEVRMKSDTLIKMQKIVMTAFDTVNKVLANDEEDKAHRIKSRARRDSLREVDAFEIQEIKKDVNRMENAIQLILSNQQRILDTIN